MCPLGFSFLQTILVMVGQREKHKLFPKVGISAQSGRPDEEAGGLDLHFVQSPATSAYNRTRSRRKFVCLFREFGEYQSLDELLRVYKGNDYIAVVTDGICTQQIINVLGINKTSLGFSSLQDGTWWVESGGGEYNIVVPVHAPG